MCGMASSQPHTNVNNFIPRNGARRDAGSQRLLFVAAR